MPRIVEISTPLRLHFGLFGFGGSGRQFGGVGVMAGLAGPRVRFSPAERLFVRGPLSERAAAFAQRWAQSHGETHEPACQIEVLSSPAEHTGLGVGTQLGLAAAAGLNEFFRRTKPSPAELALSVNRGLRSAVGTYGFALGGLIVEQGKLPGEPISPLDFQLDLPAQWQFALVRPRAASGLAGQAEQDAFTELPPVPPGVTERLVAEVRERMLPAAAQGHFDDFSQSVYEFGRESGLCFAARQGGPYNGPVLTELVAAIRSIGVAGVGQSSWGPTLYALLANDEDFPDFARDLTARLPAADLDIQLVPVNNTGAAIRVISDS